MNTAAGEQSLLLSKHFVKGLYLEGIYAYWRYLQHLNIYVLSATYTFT